MGKCRYYDSYHSSLVYRFLQHYSSVAIFLKYPSHRDSFTSFVSPFFNRKNVKFSILPVKSRFFPDFHAYFRPVSLSASVYRKRWNYGFMWIHFWYWYWFYSSPVFAVVNNMFPSIPVPLRLNAVLSIRWSKLPVPPREHNDSRVIPKQKRFAGLEWTMKLFL